MARSPSRLRGFTLIELLVVIVIIGIIVSVAVLALGDGGKRDRLLEDGRRFAALIELAGDSAVMEGREWGVRVEEDGYLFMVLQDGVWLPVKWDPMFRPRQLAAGFSLALLMDDLEVTLPVTKPDGDGDVVQPQIFLMSSAERTPFRVVLTAPGGSPQLELDAPLLGEVNLHEVAR